MNDMLVKLLTITRIYDTSNIIFIPQKFQLGEEGRNRIKSLLGHPNLPMYLVKEGTIYLIISIREMFLNKIGRGRVHDATRKVSIERIQDPPKNDSITSFHSACKQESNRSLLKDPSTQHILFFPLKVTNIA